MRLLILSGSFHSNSKSLQIARGVTEYLSHHRCDTPRLESLPFYSKDLSTDKPAAVKALLEATTACDGIVCITPEYNHSVPAVLKNAIDWASRPAFNSPLKGKPVTIISQAETPVGGARVQAHLKLVFDATLSDIFPAHEMMITGVSKVLDDNGNIVDPDTRRRLHRHLDEFLQFAEARHEH